MAPASSARASRRLSSTEELLALRLARVGLAERTQNLAEAAACPASDFARNAGLMAIAARAEGVTRERVAEELVHAHTLRGSIHVLAPGEQRVFGQSLVGESEKELAAQIGHENVEHFDPVTEATADALKGGRRLDRNELHEELRERLPRQRLAWCGSCGSHHVHGRLWRYALVRLGAVLDEQRRHRIPRQPLQPRAGETARRFLHFYPGAGVTEFAAWAGVTPSHARRLWVEADEDLASPPSAHGVRLLPPGDPYLQTPNRELLAPDPELRKRLFRPVASPGVVLQDGRLAGTWRRRGESVEVDAFTRLRKGDLDEEVERLLAV